MAGVSFIGLGGLFNKKTQVPVTPKPTTQGSFWGLGGLFNNKTKTPDNQQPVSQQPTKLNPTHYGRTQFEA